MKMKKLSMDNLRSVYMKIKMAVIEEPSSNIYANLNRKLAPVIEDELSVRGEVKGYCYDSIRMNLQRK